VNYLLFAGLALFSSACGALLVTLIRITRRDPQQAPLRADPSAEKESSR
jgi:hypothetical protein